MAEEREGIFRKQALERMSSPDRLEQLIQVVSPKEWLLLATFFGLGVLFLTWCIWGQLPTTVSGEGVIVRPRRIIELQSEAAGRLSAVNVRVGDQVKSGELIASIDQAEIRQQLEEDRARLANLELQDREESALQSQQSRLQDRDYAAQKRDLALQIANRDQTIRNTERVNAVLQERLNALHEAIKSGILPKLSSELLETEKEFLSNQALISRLQAERSELQNQVTQIETRRTELARTFLEASTTRRNRILELRRNVALNEVELEKGTRILSQQAGRIVEVDATEGEVLSRGSRLAYLELEEAPGDLACVLYFPVRDGKRLRPGMRVQTTPDSVKRERFGGIIGKVRTVSGFPVTQEGAALVLGNMELARRMLKGEPQIEVIVDLERDPATVSGYKWSSSRGPRMQITAGTTTSGRITIESRSPITYLLPFLRGMSGMD